jgi:hypothetical protein
MAKLYFAELPKDVQERFGYSPDTAAAYQRQQYAAFNCGALFRASDRFYMPRGRNTRVLFGLLPSRPVAKTTYMTPLFSNRLPPWKKNILQLLAHMNPFVPLRKNAPLDPTKSVFCATLIVLLLVSAVAQIKSHAAGLGGSFEGNVTQSKPPSTFPMEMNLYGNVGNINYPSLGCGGNLEFLRTDGTSFWYRERLSFGKDKCIDGGTIQLRRHALGDDNTWEWRWEGGGVTVRGVIRGSGVAESN